MKMSKMQKMVQETYNLVLSSSDSEIEFLVSNMNEKIQDRQYALDLSIYVLETLSDADLFTLWSVQELLGIPDEIIYNLDELDEGYYE
jgi:hypothetical protein